MCSDIIFKVTKNIFRHNNLKPFKDICVIPFIKNYAIEDTVMIQFSTALSTQNKY